MSLPGGTADQERLADIGVHDQIEISRSGFLRIPGFVEARRHDEDVQPALVLLDGLDHGRHIFLRVGSQDSTP